MEFVVQQDRPKRKRNTGPIMSLDTSLDKTNYDAFDPPIPEECLESNIDKTNGQPHTNGQPQQFEVEDVMLLI